MPFKQIRIKTLAVIASVFISGCVKNKQHKAVKPPLQAEDFKEFDDHYARKITQENLGLSYQINQVDQEYIQAKLSDVSLPLSIELVFASQPTPGLSEQMVLGYKTIQKVDQIVDFFMTEMEMFGWHVLKSFKNNESLFIFKKPQKMCAISVRLWTDKKGNEIGTLFTIFYG